MCLEIIDNLRRGSLMLCIISLILVMMAPLILIIQSLYFIVLSTKESVWAVLDTHRYLVPGFHRALEIPR